MIRINDLKCKATLKAAAVVSLFLLFCSVAGFGQQQINLTAAPTTTTLPDGTTLPMWGYFCGTAATGSTASCAALNPASTNTTPGTWSPVVITVPTGQGLTINLTNSLSFTPAGSTTANTIPTSIVIVGQVGGGLGGVPTTTLSPDHSNAQGCVSWFIANNLPGTPCTTANNQGLATPPTQGPRIQSMGTEVAAGATTALTWTALKPGTYLLESGTHPSIQVPMGLIGVLVVTTAPTSGTAAGTAYPASPTQAAVPYNSELPLEFSEIDPVQNTEVNLAVNTAGFSETAVWSAMNNVNGAGAVGCGQTHTCYPPAVNYTPLYYLINGVAFSKNTPANSVFPATAGTGTASTGTCTISATTTACPVTTGIAGTVLVRLVNAGLRMHTPSIVGSTSPGFTGAGAPAASVAGFAVIAEDGNVLPNVAPVGATTVPAAPRVQTDVLMVPSKVYDVLVNVPTVPTGAAATPALPIFARDLALSGNSSVRDAGMIAYISVNNSTPSAGLPVAAGSGIFAAAVARADTYSSLVAGQPFTVSDASKGVIANDTNVYGVTLLMAPTNGTLSCPAASSVLGIPATQATAGVGLSDSGICANGTFTWTPTAAAITAGATSDSFTYCANGTVSAGVCSSGLTATVTLGKSALSGNPSAIAQTYTAKSATFIKIPSPGLLMGNTDPNNLPLTVVTTPAVPATAGTLSIDAKGGFTLALPSTTTAASTVTFSYTVQNSQGSTSTTSGTVTVNFPAPSNLNVKVMDAQAYNACGGNSTCITGLPAFSDYRWIIEEDKTFWIDPNCTANSSITTPGCPTPVAAGGTIPTFGVQFHTSSMDFVAQGCTGPLSCEGGQTMLDTNPASTTFGTHILAVCDLGNGACRPDPSGGQGFTPVWPSSVHLDPAKRYYISVLPGDAANPFPTNLTAPNCPGGAEATAGNTACGHTMSGAPIPPACNILGGPNACTTSSAFAPVNVLVLPTPLTTGKLSVIVFEDDFPLNGEQDGGGGNGTVAPIEPGLGGFNIVLWDTYGGLGDVTGQDTYDAFNQPLSNSLAGTVDPTTGLDACPISAQASADPTQVGITGVIVTCPKYESDNFTLSPLAGQAVIANLMPDKFSVQAYPGADRIARGEQWLQTNTLDGQHPHDSFIRIGEPSYFQEYGPAGYHVAIGFANPAIINARHNDVCAGAGTPGAVGPCSNTITGQVDVQRLSRIPDERLYPSRSRDALSWTQCWVSLGDPDGEDFMFQFCDANGNFSFSNVPGGNWRLTIGDQWNDQIIDGLSTPANVGCVPVAPATTCTGGLALLPLGNVGVQQWQANLYTTTYVDDNKNGIKDPDEIGIPLIYTMIHYRDGSRANALTTDFNGVAPFNETFPLFNWYVVEADDTRYKTTGIHSVYDAGGPADGTPDCGASGARPCGSSTAYAHMTNTNESVPLPSDLSVPGAVYCAAADCGAEAAGFAAGTAKASFGAASTGRLDPPYYWNGMEGWAGLTGHSNYMEIGKAPFAACNPAAPTATGSYCATVTTKPAGATTSTTSYVGENGGIYGQIQYASTRPFEDASQMIQQPWEPYVPRVTVNLYQEGFAVDGVTPTLTLVDTTQSSSWDDWAQGFYPTGTAGTGSGAGQKPYMSCPGQGTAATDVFYFTLFDQPNYLDLYNSQHNGGTLHTLPYNSQFKCYDAMKINNQIQPAPYDGRYSFPSSTGINPTTGKSLGTNCTICVANPDTTDAYRVGTPMLPPGKYVVEVIMPPGYEIYKEEDKNLLIGDDFIAPVTQQFAGLGADIFIIPDQASVASLYDESAAGYNPNNYQDSTTALALNQELSGVPGFPGYQDPVWPCVGEQRVVPDYLSLFPNAKEVAPFAGATRPLCDRKEVILANQMSVRVKFALFTSTHIASHFTGVITDDLTSEFDPFSPQFGEKFAPPNMPISTKDYLGNELSRVYSDHWGIYNGLTFSSWEVNPPNITGYSPSMMVQCMNDPGPVLDTRATIPNPASPGTTMANPTYGQMINDPLYNSAYSDFCYEEPYMPGLTTYLDTPVVPTQAFVGAAYNNADCSYPDTTPAISEVDGDGIGPWVSAAGTTHTLTINALGDQQVSNSAYSGPSASAAPFNMKTITRHYGFGAQCSTPAAGSTTCNTTSSVTIGGIPAPINSWSDTQIVVAVPSGVPNCEIQQQAQYVPAGTTSTQCGQLLITAGNGKQSIDTVTVTIGGKAPTHVSTNSTIQAAIDQAAPGDLIIVDPTCIATAAAGTSAGQVQSCSSASLHAATPTQTASVGSHSEMLLMWKPVRLQGVGAASSIISANAIPAGKLLDPWRRHVNCLFGLTLQGVPEGAPIPVPGTNTTTPAVYDSTSTYSCPDTDPGPTGTPVPWNYFNGGVNTPQVDRLPLEATVGWDATQNGNLAEQLQEPSLMGAYEGAGITVLAKGVNFHGLNPWSDGNEAGAFPPGTTLLTGVGPNPLNLPLGDANPACHTSNRVTTNPYPSNFTCNPSSIDGLSIINSSQGGGGIFAHGWAHHLQIANNRVYNNVGTLTGGISVGQGEFPTPYLMGSTTNAAPGSCSNGAGEPTNQHMPYCLQLDVNVHNNSVTTNSSLGDELFSGTLSGGGGATFCTGNDYYKFNYNWVCGNLSSGEGGGLVHLGEIQNGDIEHNSFVLNQSDNPTIPTNGGGIQIMGTPDTDPVCGTAIDADCPPGLSDGTGRNLIINANLIQGNMAESGSGGGIRLQQVNGTEVSLFPSQSRFWNSVSITNNIIANNVAGWDGAGISLQDSLNVSIVNNTIASNDSLASSGVLTQSIGTPDASAPPGNGVCTVAGLTTSCPQSAGVTSTLNSTLLTGTFTGLTIRCPQGQPNCTVFSNPLLENNVIWQNRSFYIGITGAGSGLQNQQNLVALFPTLVQTASGACATGASYWDIGVRGDTGPGNHASGATLNPTYSVLDDTGYASSNLTVNPTITSQYCNGSRVPPECTVAAGCSGPSGYGVPPGIVDAQTPNPVFSLTPSATVDEGNNWINVSWGPLSLANDAVAGGTTGNFGGGLALGNYALNAGSPAIDYIPATGRNGQPHPAMDFFGNLRPDPGNPNAFDVGAIEFQAAVSPAVLVVTPPSLTFPSTVDTTTSAAQTLTVRNNGGAPTTVGISVAVSAGFARPAGGGGGSCAAGTPLAGGASCTINIVFAPAAGTPAGTVTGTATITSGALPVTNSPVTLTGTAAAAVITATVTPTSLTFGPQLDGTTSPAQTLTVRNTGNVALAGGSFTFGGGTPQPFARATGAFGAGGTCGGGLAVGATCTYNVVFTPPVSATTSYSRNLTVAYTGATVTGSPVSLTGTATPAGTLTFTSATNGTLGTVFGVRTLTFTIPMGRPAVTSVVTITNTGVAPLAITAETLAVNLGGLYSITGTTCTAPLTVAPAAGSTCTVSINYATPGTRPVFPDVGLMTVTNNGSGTTGGVTGLGLVAQ